MFQTDVVVCNLVFRQLQKEHSMQYYKTMDKILERRFIVPLNHVTEIFCSDILLRDVIEFTIANRFSEEKHELMIC